MSRQSANFTSEDRFFARTVAPIPHHAPTSTLLRAAYLPDSTLVRKGSGARHDIEPGCTVVALDYRASYQKHNVKGYAAPLVETATGGKRLACSGPTGGRKALTTG